MKEEILKKVQELFDLLQEHKVAAMFIADLGGESIKATNVPLEGVAKLMIVQLNGDDELQDHFLAELERTTENLKLLEEISTEN